MIEATTKTVAGEARRAVRWGPNGTAYVCASDSDCWEATQKALDWARANGVSEEEIEADGGTLITGPAPVRVTPAGEDRAARLRESRRRFTAR